MYIVLASIVNLLLFLCRHFCIHIHSNVWIVNVFLCRHFCRSDFTINSFYQQLRSLNDKPMNNLLEAENT